MLAANSSQCLLDSEGLSREPHTVERLLIPPRAAAHGSTAEGLYMQAVLEAMWAESGLAGLHRKA